MLQISVSNPIIPAGIYAGKLELIKNSVFMDRSQSTSLLILIETDNRLILSDDYSIK